VASRLEWLGESLAVVRALQADGVPVLGYTWFPFFTLVDWLYRHDTKTPDEWFIHMGLVDLERGADRVLARRRTAVFEAFQREAAGSDDVSAGAAGGDSDSEGVAVAGD
jgi:hypothetical protein